MKRDGTASDKHNETHVSVPPPLPQTATLVDEPIAGEHQSTPSSKISTLMTEVLHKENLKRALERVKRNKGAPGIDGMTVDELGAHLKAHWPSIRAQLVDGSYQPKPVSYDATHGSNGAARDTASSGNAGSVCGRLGTQARARMGHGA